MNALNCSDLGPYGFGKPSAPSGFQFGFGISGPGVCDSDFMPCFPSGNTVNLPCDFGYCGPQLGPDNFIYAGLPSNPLLEQWLQPSFDLLDLMGPQGPPTLARTKKKIDCVNHPCFSDPTKPIIQSYNTWWQALQTCATFLPLMGGGNSGPGTIENVDQYPEGQMGTQNSRSYQEYNPVSHAQGAAAANGMGQVGNWSGCTGGGLSH
jgi:hypothetical protein